MKYLTLYKNNRQYITSSLTRKHPNVSFLTEENIVKYQEEPDKLDQEILDSLVAVVICDGKTNNDSDRDTVKNLVDPDNPFVLTGFNWKLNSGYGKYEEDFTSWIQTNGVIASSDKVQNSVVGRFLYFNAVNKKDDIPSFKVNITLGQQSKLQYNYIKEDGTGTYIVYSESGIYTIPTSYFSKYTGGNAWFGFYQIEGTSIIEQIPSFQGALVTDGIDDMITSTKTAQEMLSGSNEITVVSMVHQITTPNNYNYTNIIRYDLNTQGLTNIVQKDLGVGKAGIYGYSANLSNSSISVINNILGDKSDYIVPDAYTSSNISAKYSVQGWMNKYNSHSEISSVAWYWTVISKKSLTTDNINQIIKYYNLDKYIEPTIYYNVAKQGITNENHSDFSDKLIDYSGNNKDLQLYNFSWDEGSGIGRYELDFTSMDYNDTLSVFTTTHKSCSISKILKDSDGNIFYNWSQNLDSINSIRIQVTGLNEIGAILEFRYLNESGNSVNSQYSSDGIYDLPASSAYQGDSNTTNFRFSVRGYVGDCNITITQIPYGVLILDGVNDYGKVENLPIYKDYTVIVDREIESANGGLLSKEKSTDSGAFIFEYYRLEKDTTASFGYLNYISNLDRNRKISYQSKYSYNGVPLSSGTRTDSTYMYLGALRDGQSSFSKCAIYSILSFPYSMSEFLIERQLKMYNLGTLYPGMVEFRPTVNSNVDYKHILYYRVEKSNWTRINPGDYITIGQRIAIKIFPNGIDEVVSATSSDLSNISIISKTTGDESYYFLSYLTSNSPQKINITIDEYIRYEDIIQPYPVVFQIKDRTTNQIYSWGDKIKVGSSIQLFHDESPNLLSGLYRIDSYEYEGKTYTYNQLNNLDITLTKSSISISCNKTWILDDNEPKCILSPERLRIPNSSYSILGYIPDISGHGNNFTFNNFLFSGMSGANGYLQNFNEWTIASGVSSTDSVISSSKKLVASNGWIAYVISGTVIPTFRVKISGIPVNGNLRFEGSDQSLANGINTIQGLTSTKVTGFYISSGYENDWSNLKIEQIGEYEGSICFDGIDDFILNNGVRGGKQIIMKCNWWSTVGTSILYDQRGNGNEFAIFNADSDGSLDDTFIAYSGRSNGNTYIDGILNSNIHCRDLVGLTHNITHTNELNAGPNSATVRLGCNNAVQYFSQMALYDLMIFNEISTDDKIKELNEYIGIESKVELPDYYWDAYGKTNSDADRDTIQQRGIAVGDYDLTNTNFAYDKMSGFGGYTLGKFTNSWSLSNNSNSISIVAHNPYDITLKKLGENSDWEFNTTELKIISNPVSVKFKSDKNIRFTCDYHYYTVGGNSEGAPLGITSKDLIANEDTIITISPISQENIDKYNIDINRGYYLIYFQLSPTLAVNEEVTIEMLPLYPNGLVYDGVDDYSKNENIPVLTDYTIIAKRLWINKDNPLNEQFIHKGAINTPISESAFMLEYEIANDTYYRSSSYGGYINIERSNRPERIVYQTSNSYNGTSITKGSGTDTTGIVIGGVTNNYWNGVFYKLMLYSKTLPLLQINYLKNLMERDEIIDLNNSIFIK